MMSTTLVGVPARGIPNPPVVNIGKFGHADKGEAKSEPQDLSRRGWPFPRESL